jgi:hypothetical protein
VHAASADYRRASLFWPSAKQIPTCGCSEKTCCEQNRLPFSASHLIVLDVLEIPPRILESMALVLH